MNNQFSLNNHPKINALQNKIEILNVDRKLKANMLLPKIDLGYSYLSEPSYFNNYQFNDYKIGMNFYFPLFLRKERGNLKLAKFKVQETEFLLEFERLQLQKPMYYLTSHNGHFGNTSFIKNGIKYYSWEDIHE